MSSFILGDLRRVEDEGALHQPRAMEADAQVPEDYELPWKRFNGNIVNIDDEHDDDNIDDVDIIIDEVSCT